MKRSYLYLIVVTILLASCKEKDPIINFSNVHAAADTTYVLATVPAADPHNILVEEFTGQDCSNCPPARLELDQLETANPGRINTVGLYINNFPQTIPLSGAVYDFRTAVATTIGSAIYGGINGMPVAGIDRVFDATSGNIQAPKSDWPSIIGTQLAITDSVNLSVQSSFNATTDTATIVVNITYLQATSAQQYISMYIVEDSMTDLQEDGTSIDQNYLFMNVCRDMITTQPLGDIILPALTSKEAGRVDKITYNYRFNPNNQTPAWVPQHCRVVAFVSNSTASDGQILQSEQTKLAP